MIRVYDEFSYFLVDQAVAEIKLRDCGLAS